MGSPCLPLPVFTSYTPERERERERDSAERERETRRERERERERPRESASVCVCQRYKYNQHKNLNQCQRHQLRSKKECTRSKGTDIDIGNWPARTSAAHAGPLHLERLASDRFGLLSQAASDCHRGRFQLVDTGAFLALSCCTLRSMYPSQRYTKFVSMINSMPVIIMTRIICHNLKKLAVVLRHEPLCPHGACVPRRIPAEAASLAATVSSQRCSAKCSAAVQPSRQHWASACAACSDHPCCCRER